MVFFLAVSHLWSIDSKIDELQESLKKICSLLRCLGIFNEDIYNLEMSVPDGLIGACGDDGVGGEAGREDGGRGEVPDRGNGVDHLNAFRR